MATNPEFINKTDSCVPKRSANFTFLWRFGRGLYFHYLQWWTLFFTLSIARMLRSNFLWEIIKCNTKESVGLSPTFNSIFLMVWPFLTFINISILFLRKYFEQQCKLFCWPLRLGYNNSTLSVYRTPNSCTGTPKEKGARWERDGDWGKMFSRNSTITWTTYFTLWGRLTNSYIIHFRMPCNICNVSADGLDFFPSLASAFVWTKSIICLNIFLPLYVC